MMIVEGVCMRCDDRRFVRPAAGFVPAYRRLGPAALRERATEALDLLRRCCVCPRDCRVDRLAGCWAVCRTGRWAIVSSCGPHFGEEDCLRGSRGSGTIFFAMCTLRCVFCQNYEISHLGYGQIVGPDVLAAMMLHLQDAGCHNINLVTPEHVVPQLLEALHQAVEAGLRLPIVYNTSAFDSMHSLRLLDGVVDIYMPDFKVWDRETARHYLLAPSYPDVARAAIAEMHRQVGDLVTDEHGVAQHGMLVRHLVMPGDVAGTTQIMHWLAGLSTDMYVNLMAQYAPAGQVTPRRFSELNRRVTADEMRQAYAAARRAGIWRFDERCPQHTAARRVTV
jgi:putative pyruvate formate lyase activating enzyme